MEEMKFDTNNEQEGVTPLNDQEMMQEKLDSLQMKLLEVSDEEKGAIEEEIVALEEKLGLVA